MPLHLIHATTPNYCDILPTLFGFTLRFCDLLSLFLFLIPIVIHLCNIYPSLYNKYHIPTMIFQSHSVFLSVLFKWVVSLSTVFKQYISVIRCSFSTILFSCDIINLTYFFPYLRIFLFCTNLFCAVLLSRSAEHQFSFVGSFNPFVSNALFLHPLKILP